MITDHVLHVPQYGWQTSLPCQTPFLVLNAVPPKSVMQQFWRFSAHHDAHAGVNLTAREHLGRRGHLSAAGPWQGSSAQMALRLMLGPQRLRRQLQHR